MSDKFPLEKILTISARDYIASTQMDITRFNFVGVQGTGFESIDYTFNSFRDAIPGNAKVVTDLELPRFPGGVYHGTALVPKTSDDPK